MAKQRKKKLSKKQRIILYTTLAVLSVAVVVVAWVLAITFDKYGRIWYITAPAVVVTFAGFLLAIYSLLQLYPYANTYDKKRLKRKKLVFMECPLGAEQVKAELIKLFEHKGRGYNLSRETIAVKWRFNLHFYTDADIEMLADRVDKYVTKLDLSSKLHNNRTVEICFIESADAENTIKTLEDALDGQFLDNISDPARMFVPLIFDTTNNRIYYYNKWKKYGPFTRTMTWRIARATTHTLNILKTAIQNLNSSAPQVLESKQENINNSSTQENEDK